MSYSKRTRTLKNGSFIGKSVLYWMVRDKRFNDNWALFAAQKAALKNKVPYCTNMSTALACIEGIRSLKSKKIEINSLQEIK